MAIYNYNPTKEMNSMFSTVLNPPMERKKLFDELGTNRPESYGQYNLNQNDMMGMLQRLFNQGSSNLSGTMQRAGSGAGMNAFGQGQSMGLSNPFSLQQRARNSTMSQFAPQFGELEQNRLNQGMNMPFKVNEFNRANQMMGFQDLMKYYGLKSQLVQPTGSSGSDAFGVGDVMSVLAAIFSGGSGGGE
jgi:hypothetical protein